jgi:hypothetical protein
MLSMPDKETTMPNRTKMLDDEDIEELGYRKGAQPGDLLTLNDDSEIPMSVIPQALLDHIASLIPKPSVYNVDGNATVAAADVLGFDAIIKPLIPLVNNVFNIIGTSTLTGQQIGGYDSIMAPLLRLLNVPTVQTIMNTTEISPVPITQVRGLVSETDSITADLADLASALAALEAL